MNQRILDGLRAVRQQVLINAAGNTDAQALVVKSLRPEWSALPDGTILTKQAEAVIGTEITMVRHDGKLYKVRQTHPKQAAYELGKGTEALFAVVDEGHAGTFDDPIPAAAGMEYIKGKYYSEDGRVYKMDRAGMEDGESIVLQYLPSQLLGQYFSLAEGEENGESVS